MDGNKIQLSERLKNESKPGIFSETRFERTNPARGALWDAQHLQLWKHHGNIEAQPLDRQTIYRPSKKRSEGKRAQKPQRYDGRQHANSRTGHCLAMQKRAAKVYLQAI